MFPSTCFDGGIPNHAPRRQRRRCLEALVDRTMKYEDHALSLLYLLPLSTKPLCQTCHIYQRTPTPVIQYTQTKQNPTTKRDYTLIPTFTQHSSKSNHARRPSQSTPHQLPHLPRPRQSRPPGTTLLHLLRPLRHPSTARLSIPHPIIPQRRNPRPAPLRPRIRPRLHPELAPRLQKHELSPMPAGSPHLLPSRDALPGAHQLGRAARFVY